RVHYVFSASFPKLMWFLRRYVPEIDFHEFIGSLKLATCGRRCPQRIICRHYASSCCAKKYSPAAPLPPHHTLAPPAHQTTGLRSKGRRPDNHRLRVRRCLNVVTA